MKEVFLFKAGVGEFLERALRGLRLPEVCLERRGLFFVRTGVYML
jgi:hypothetical protein